VGATGPRYRECSFRCFCISSEVAWGHAQPCVCVCVCVCVYIAVKYATEVSDVERKNRCLVAFTFLIFIACSLF
jgi:hypothetical protein